MAFCTIVGTYLSKYLGICFVTVNLQRYFYIRHYRTFSNCFSGVSKTYTRKLIEALSSRTPLTSLSKSRSHVEGVEDEDGGLGQHQEVAQRQVSDEDVARRAQRATSAGGNG